MGNPSLRLSEVLDIFLRIAQVLRIFTNNNGIIRNDIEGNVLFCRVVRVIPH